MVLFTRVPSSRITNTGVPGLSAPHARDNRISPSRRTASPGTDHAHLDEVFVYFVVINSQVASLGIHAVHRAGCGVVQPKLDIVGVACLKRVVCKVIKPSTSHSNGRLVKDQSS